MAEKNTHKNRQIGSNTFFCPLCQYAKIDNFCCGENGLVRQEDSHFVDNGMSYTMAMEFLCGNLRGKAPLPIAWCEFFLLFLPIRQPCLLSQPCEGLWKEMKRTQPTAGQKSTTIRYRSFWQRKVGGSLRLCIY